MWCHIRISYIIVYLPVCVHELMLNTCWKCSSNTCLVQRIIIRFGSGECNPTDIPLVKHWKWKYLGHCCECRDWHKCALNANIMRNQLIRPSFKNECDEQENYKFRLFKRHRFCLFRQAIISNEFLVFIENCFSIA